MASAGSPMAGIPAGHSAGFRREEQLWRANLGTPGMLLARGSDTVVQCRGQCPSASKGEARFAGARSDDPRGTAIVGAIATANSRRIHAAMSEPSQAKPCRPNPIPTASSSLSMDRREYARPDSQPRAEPVCKSATNLRRLLSPVSASSQPRLASWPRSPRSGGSRRTKEL
jgi:hypothetical protein